MKKYWIKFKGLPFKKQVQLWIASVSAIIGLALFFVAFLQLWASRDSTKEELKAFVQLVDPELTVDMRMVRDSTGGLDTLRLYRLNYVLRNCGKTTALDVQDGVKLWFLPVRCVIAWPGSSPVPASEFHPCVGTIAALCCAL